MEQAKSEGIVFNLENCTNLPDPQVETLPNLYGTHTWLSAIFDAKSKLDWRSADKISKSIDENSIKIMPDSIISSQMDATHKGLMQYIFSAWAQELGVVLKPDVFFYTVVSEIKNQIISNPDKYRHLLTSSDKKEEIIVVGLTVDTLLDALEQKVPCKDLFNLVSKTSFSTEPKHFKQVLGITMADMGTPYYSYGTTRCGIPKVMVLGEKSEWDKLVASIISLKNIFDSCCNVLSEYLVNVLGTINKFIEAVFEDNDKEYFRNMFIYHKNPKCGSGHEPVVLNGWIKHLYICKYYKERFLGHDEHINRYPSHLNCLPYDDKDDPSNIKYFCYICGLSSSKNIDGYLYPEYNIAHCEIVHPDNKTIFDVIACNNKN